jgi:rhodanese-related sulfurtransferase
MFRSRSVLQFLAVTAFVGWSLGVQAQETPMQAPAGVKLVEAKDVQDLQAKGALIVDTRRASEYGEGSIKGAISVPYDPEKSAKAADFDASQDKFDLSKLADKGKDIVVFCNSGTCWKSYKAAVVLAKNGYKNVYWYRNGMPDWKARKLPIE